MFGEVGTTDLWAFTISDTSTSGRFGYVDCSGL